jgi:hypothetical protein
MIHLDEHDLPTSIDDGMDSCVRQAIITMCNSHFKNWALMCEYERNGYGVRHPHESPANNRWNFTGDQLAMLIAGLHAAGDVKAIRRLFWRHVKRLGFCQNFERDVTGSTKYLWPHTFYKDSKPNPTTVLWPAKLQPLPGVVIESKKLDFADLCSPSRFGMMIVGGRIWWLYWALPLCRGVNRLNICATARSTHDEMNQLIAECSVLGTIETFKRIIPAWHKRSEHYWSVRNEIEYHDMLVQWMNNQPA